MSNRFPPLLASVLFVLASCAPRPARQLTDTDRDALRRLTDTQVSAGLAADWDRFVATLHDDVVRMPPDQPSVRGRDVVKAWQKTFPPIAKLENSIDAIDGDGEIAYMRGHNQITLKINGKPTQLSFKWLAVYRKQAKRSWVMVADMWNGNPLSAATVPGT